MTTASPERSVTASTTTSVTTTTVQSSRGALTPSVPAARASVVSLQPLGESLEALVALEADWDSYGALPPARAALERAWALASSMVEQGLDIPRVLPTRKGGIQLEWHPSHASLDLEIDPDGSTGVFLFDDHRTGATLDGDLPGDVEALVSALTIIRRA